MGSRYEWETDEVDTDIDYDLRCYFVGVTSDYTETLFMVA